MFPLIRSLPILAACALAGTLAEARGTPEPAAAKAPDVRIETQVAVDAKSMTPARFVAPESGVYRLTIRSGAFRYLPEGQKPPSPYDGWLTKVEVFKNKPVAWGAPDEWGKHPVGADGSVGVDDRLPTRAQAEAAAREAAFTVELEKGQELLFLVSDGSDWYGDNVGSVTIGISAEIPQSVEETPEDT
ncbi:MAG: hypothetical protein HUU04_06445 [Verrucomicrobiae bacterium]|nr:hypothetical protein [Verrucomicrobiae bacterium]